MYGTGTYKGKYKLRKPEKYDGDPENVVYRSSWERAAFKWCEANPKVKKFSSEEVVIPYFCHIDNKMHRYYVDLKIVFESGRTYIIEIKPSAQTIPPKGKRTKKLLNEQLTFVRNKQKWAAAKKYADERGWVFQVWTEVDLKKMGMKIL